MSRLESFEIREQSEEVAMVSLGKFGLREQSEEAAMTRLD